MKTDYITRKDLDNAIKQPWSTDTCLLAQVALRLNKSDDRFSMTQLLYNIADNNPKADQAMLEFDEAYGRTSSGLTAYSSLLKTLRNSLPIKIKYE